MNDYIAAKLPEGRFSGAAEAEAQEMTANMDAKRRTIPQTVERWCLAFAALLVVLIGLLAYNSWAAFRRSSDQAAVTRQVTQTTNALLSSLKDAETGQRGFLLTGEERYLQPYRQALTDIPPDLDTLTRLEARRGPAGQSARLARLKPLVKDKLDELALTIDLRRSQGLEAALAVVLTDRGQAFMEQIRGVCAEIEAATYTSLDEQTEKTRSGANELGLIAILGSAVIFAFLALATVSIERGTRRRQQLIDTLQVSEEQIKRSRDWLQTTLASIGDAVITTDGNGNVTLLNPVAQTLTGWNAEEAVGKPLGEIFMIRNEETGREVENPVTRVLREGGIVGLANHTNLLSKDGKHVPIDDSAAPIRDGGGQIAGVVLVFRDITERKRAERAIESSVDELRSANAALARANEDLSQFAFAASHDLQEPLRMITSYSQLLMKGYRGELDGKAATCIEFITQGTRRMRDLLSDLLTYTQLTGDDEPSQPVDLNEVVQIVLENCRFNIEEARATVTSDPLPSVLGNKQHFVQLLQNLISNSLKYRSEHSPLLRLMTARENDQWRIAVKDNGVGIAPEYHKQIFGVFKRLHGKDISGTGMGLAICQRVVDRYGGRIWVESHIGQGATFYFTVPGSPQGGRP